MPSADAGPRSWSHTARLAARRDWAFLLLLGVGAVLRGAVVYAYHPAFWYQADSRVYLDAALIRTPDPARPFGYSALLLLLEPLGSVRVVAAVQHVAGLAIAVAAYIYLRRRGVSRLASTLAMAPLVLDARTIVVEHYILAETLFTSLTLAGVLLLTARGRPGWWLIVAGGLLLAAAALTRTVGVVILSVALAYLFARRLGWRALAAYALAAALPLLGYAAWYQAKRGEFSLGTYSGRFLYSRTATFVDCGRLRLTATEARMCPPEPLAQRGSPDLYLWGPTSANMLMRGRRYDDTFASFARKAIIAQPVDYVRTVAVDTVIFMRPDGGEVDRPGNQASRLACLAALWQIPSYADAENTCQPRIGYGTVQAHHFQGFASATANRLDAPLSRYTRLVVVPATTVIGLALLFVLALMAWGSRRLRWPDAVDPLFWTGIALALLVAAIATSAPDPRYAVPALPFAMVGAALAWGHFRSHRVPTPPVRCAGPAPVPTADPQEP